jgi:hypothetical protein
MGFRWSPERLGGAPEIVLEEPGFRQRAADWNLLVARQPRPFQEPHQQRCSRFATTTLQSLNRFCVGIEGGHGQEYTLYTGQLR